MAHVMESPTAAKTFEFEERTPLLDKPAELRRVAQEDGFLFFITRRTLLRLGSGFERRVATRLF